MKTALILFTDPLDKLNCNYLGEITNSLLKGGFPVDTTKILSVCDDLGFKRSIGEFKDTVDNLIIINNEKLTFNIKEIIADQTETTLVENENAYKLLDAVKKAHDKDYADDNAVLPMEATLIPNLFGAFQGFMLDDNELTLVLLPEPLDQLTVSCEKYLLPYLEEKYQRQLKRMVLKYFGSEEKLQDAIQDAKTQVNGKIEISLSEKHGDWTVSLMAEESLCLDFVRILVSKLQEEIYADFECSLGQRLFDLLKLKNLKLATAESFTGGRVVNSVISNAGASKFVHEGIVCYSNDSKAQRLNINVQDVIKDGAVSSMTAYRMTVGLLRSGKIDLAISTTGYAGPKSPDSKEPVGLAFIGIGMMDGVHTYKLNLNGSREEITETAKNTALFLAIKKLKSIK